MALNFFVVAVLLLTQSDPNRSVTPQFSSPSRAFAYANAPDEKGKFVLTLKLARDRAKPAK